MPHSTTTTTQVEHHQQYRNYYNIVNAEQQQACQFHFKLPQEQVAAMAAQKRSKADDVLTFHSYDPSKPKPKRKRPTAIAHTSTMVMPTTSVQQQQAENVQQQQVQVTISITQTTDAMKKRQFLKRVTIPYLVNKPQQQQQTLQQVTQDLLQHMQHVISKTSAML